MDIYISNHLPINPISQLGETKMDTQETQADPHGIRLEKLRKLSVENELNGIILVPGPNLRYFTSVNSLLLERPFIFLVPSDGQAHVVAPTLESGPFFRASVPIVVHSWDDGEGPTHAITEAVEHLGLQGRWGIEGRAPYRYVQLLLKSTQAVLEDAEPILQQIRVLKDEREIKLLQRAASILSKSFTRIPSMLKAGISEMELARKLAEETHRNGAESVEHVLVQSGPMAADGHHLPGSRKIRRKESVVVDATCTFSGYFADITRTFILGKDPTFEGLYENVLAAQINAIDASRKGATVGSIDHAARSHLERNGLGQYFVHRTGHGLGLEVHEAPYINPNGNEIVQASMVFTVEPGVYMRNKTGVRIEDNILVTEQGRNVLTKSLPKEFAWWS